MGMQVRRCLHVLEHGRIEASEGLSRLRKRLRSRVDRAARLSQHEVHLNYETRGIPCARLVARDYRASFVGSLDHRHARLFILGNMPPLVVPAWLPEQRKA